MMTPPIFVVGVQRSGTTLLAAMLAAHSKLSCGPETHFFRWLDKVDVSELCATETWPEPARAFIGSIDHVGPTADARVSLIDNYRIDAADIDRYLRTRPASVASILGSVVEQHMTAQGKRRWVEKTPDHLRHVQAIRQHFPDALIVRVVRDPRDVALSLMKVPWGVRSFLEGLLYWDRMETAGREVLVGDPRCHTVRFEDLVSEPRETLRQLCGFIDEAFEEGMLDTSESGQLVNARRAPWKMKATQAVDRRRVEAWRAELTPTQNQLAEAVLGDQILALGYAREAEFTRAATVQPGLAVALNEAAALERLASDGLRFWSEPAEARPPVTVYVGEPGTTEWQGSKPEGDLAGVVRVMARVVGTVVKGGEVYWVREHGRERWTGCLPYVVKRCLSPFRVSVEHEQPSPS